MKRLNIIIVAEGAIDSSNKTITTDYVKDVSTELCVGKPQLFGLAPVLTCTTALLPRCGSDSVAVFLERSIRHTL